MERKKLELQINQPKEIELLFDEPIVGSSKFGSYNLYAVKLGGEEFSFFAPDEIHSELKNLKKGDTAIVTKLAAQRGSKLITTYGVVTKPLNKVQTVAVDEMNEVISEMGISDICSSDSYYEKMLQSLNDAIRIQKELGPTIDIMKIGISIFISRVKNYTNGN